VHAGEKPFETIEDLVQDGLITLYMEANNVEDYLQTARETRSLRRIGTVGQGTSAGTVHHSSSDEAVFSEESGEGGTPPHTPGRTTTSHSQRKLPYQPGKFPHHRDSTRGPGPTRSRELPRIYEEVMESEVPPPVPNGLERPPPHRTKQVCRVILWLCVWRYNAERFLIDRRLIPVMLSG